MRKYEELEILPHPFLTAMAGAVNSQVLPK
jgi:hypothetical protein